MRLELVHRRLVVLMALSGLLAFASGAGFEPISAIPAAAALLASLFWRPSETTVEWLERLTIPLALLLVARAFLIATLFGGDLVVPVVDLLLLLVCFEVLRSADMTNDVRLYALSFALVLASTAYRPGALFALSFLLFVVLGSAAIAIGLVRRKSIRFGAPDATLDRSFVVTSLGLSVVTFAMAIAVFVTFPRVSRSWPGRGDVAATSIAGFSDRISLGQHGATIAANPEVVLQVEFPGGRPERLGNLRWRGRSYDRFDGVVWTRSDPDRPANTPVRWLSARWPDTTVVQKITAAPLDVPVVFGLNPLRSVEPDSPIRPLMDDVGDWFYWGSPSRPSYTAVSTAVQPDADALRASAGSYFPDPDRYLQLPDLAARVVQLADSLTAPFDSRYDRVASIHRYLTTEFGYTRDLPATARQTSLDHFLFERREGHCEYFSSSMVVLLRAAGIHARNVNGFLGGEWNEFGDFLSVSQNEAHSWVEVWFPGHGWVEWDPTPAGSGGGTAAGGWWTFPGSRLFSGLSYRWTQWVLEYDLALQANLFGRLTEFLGGDEDGAASTEGGLPGGVWLWLVGGLGGVILVRFVVTPRPKSVRPESRAWGAFVRRVERTGLIDSDAVPPSELLRRIERERPEAFPAAERFTTLYLRLRFGGVDPDPADLGRLRSLLAEAKRAVS
ncbi:MAG TPA: DUF3488 and transglutaminase-like domain-containing protein [Longimicrobiales bacterium]|nr:DUF3488 and transglutaminase-like domain-containing protein [Longimicrobiales bacterium]